MIVASDVIVAMLIGAMATIIGMVIGATLLIIGLSVFLKQTHAHIISARSQYEHTSTIPVVTR